jgi:hypothetical protein
MDLYIIFQIIIVSIAATSTMRLFSYAISAKYRKSYREHLLLTYLLHNFKINLSNASKNTLSWLLHYGIGVVFVTVYYYFWANNIVEISIIGGLLLGVFSGIIGIICWMIFFKFSHYNPVPGLRIYYILASHIIFALTATAVYAISLTVALITDAYFAPK